MQQKQQIIIFNFDTIFHGKLSLVQNEESTLQVADEAVLIKLWQLLTPSFQIVLLSEQFANKAMADYFKTILGDKIDIASTMLVFCQVRNAQDLNTNIILEYNYLALKAQRSSIAEVEYASRVTMIDTQDSRLQKIVVEAGYKRIIFTDLPSLCTTLETNLKTAMADLEAANDYQQISSTNSFWQRHRGKISAIATVSGAGVGCLAGFLSHQYLLPKAIELGLLADLGIGSGAGTVLVGAPLLIANIVTSANTKHYSAPLNNTSVVHSVVEKIKSAFSSKPTHDDEEALVPMASSSSSKNYGSL